MVKRLTNFKEVYLVDADFLNKRNKTPSLNNIQPTLSNNALETQRNELIAPTRNISLNKKDIEIETVAPEGRTKYINPIGYKKIKTGNENERNIDVNRQTQANNMVEYIDVENSNGNENGRNTNFIGQTQTRNTPEHMDVEGPRVMSFTELHKPNLNTIESKKSNSDLKIKSVGKTYSHTRKPYLKISKKIASSQNFKDKRNINNWKNQYFCNICKKELRDYSSLKSHVISMHQMENMSYHFPADSRYKVVAFIPETDDKPYPMEMDPYENNILEINNSNIFSSPSPPLMEKETDPKYYSDFDVSAQEMFQEQNNLGGVSIRNDFGTQSNFVDKTNLMGPLSVRKDLGIQENFQDNTNIMGPLTMRNELANQSHFEDNTNLMGPGNVRHELASTSNFSNNANVMGPLQIRETLANDSNFKDNSNIILPKSKSSNKLSIRSDIGSHLNLLDNRNIMGPQEVTKMQDLESYWCTKCNKFFKNFNTLKQHLSEDHNDGVVKAKRSKTKEQVKRFYTDYNA